MSKKIEISESRFLSLSYGALVFIASGVIAFTMWLSSIDSTARANTIQIGYIQEDDDLQLKILRDVDRRTAKIEGLLEAMVPRKNKGK